MDETMVTVLEILGPAVLLVLLIWLAMRGRSKGGGTSAPEQASKQASEQKTERATDRIYKEEEQRRREGTDDL
jgi:hypothetical protein